MSNAHDDQIKREIGKRDPNVGKRELIEKPSEEASETLLSDDELDRLHEEKMKKMPRSEVQKIIDELNREDEEQKKHEQDVDNVIDKKHKQGY